MFKNNKIRALFGIKHPVIQGGMVWVSGWKLASAVSNAGGLGLIGAGSMKSDLLREHIRECKKGTSKPFGVNIPLLRKDADELIKTTLEEGVKIIFTSAGSPAKYTGQLKSEGITVVHVVSNVKQGLKAENAGCHAVVGEGVEAGGHNGADEITTFCLIPQLASRLSIPVIGAGGIADGRGMAAALALGAEGVQIGTRFAVSAESSAHEFFKQKLIESDDRGTELIFRNYALVRLIKSDYSARVRHAECAGVTPDRLKMLLGEKREKKGIFEGDLTEGMMEAGQSAGMINSVEPVEKIIRDILMDFENTIKNLGKIF